MFKTTLVSVLIALFLLAGEIQCVVKFATSDFKPSYKREAIYLISAVTGIGGVVGWLNIKDSE